MVTHTHTLTHHEVPVLAAELDASVSVVLLELPTW